MSRRKPDICMVYDEESANAFDAFPYTPEELERRTRTVRESASRGGDQ